MSNVSISGLVIVIAGFVGAIALYFARPCIFVFGDCGREGECAPDDRKSMARLGLATITHCSFKTYGNWMDAPQFTKAEGDASAESCRSLVDRPEKIGPEVDGEIACDGVDLSSTAEVDCRNYHFARAGLRCFACKKYPLRVLRVYSNDCARGAVFSASGLQLGYVGQRGARLSLQAEK